MPRMSTGLFSPTTEFLATFPKNGELELKTLLDIYFFTCYVPFRVVYDHGKQAYTVQVSLIPKVICFLRAIGQFIRLLQLLFNVRVSIALRLPGPIKIFLYGQSTLLFVCGMMFYFTVFSASFQNSVLAVFNMIKFDSGDSTVIRMLHHHCPHKNSSRYRNSTQIKVYFHCVCAILITSVTYIANQLGRSGFESALHTIWLGIIDRVEIVEDFTMWKRLVSFPILMAEFDKNILLACAYLLLFISGNTLHSLTTHLVESLKDCQDYCVISWEEIITHFRKLRKIFMLLGNSLGWILLGAIVTGSMIACIGIVWGPVDPSGALTISISLSISFVYMAMFVARSAQACQKLKYISNLLCSHNHSRLVLGRGRGPGPYLPKLITIFELGNGSVSLKASDIFGVTFAFIGSVTISTLSNTTIVMQSIDTLKEFVAALFRPPE